MNETSDKGENSWLARRGCLIKHFFMKSPLLSTFLLCLMSASCSAAQHFYSCSTLVTTVWYRQWNIFARTVKYFCLMDLPWLWSDVWRWGGSLAPCSPPPRRTRPSEMETRCQYVGVRFGFGRRVNRSSDCGTVLWQCCGWRTGAPVAKTHQWSNCLHM